MKSATLAFAVAAATLGFASSSMAQGYDNGYQGRAQPRVEYRVVPQYQDPRAYERRVDDRRGYDRRDQRRFGARGQEFRRGGYIPNEYRGRQYQVNDWRARHLPAPQPGQQWVNTGANYALIAIATGLIANLVLN